MVAPVTTWRQLEDLAPDLTGAGRTLLINCAPEWGIALLGTVRVDGAPRIGPLCVYLLDGGLFATVEGQKEQDLVRDPRFFLHSYWGDGQDEFAVAGVADDALDASRRDASRRPGAPSGRCRASAPHTGNRGRPRRNNLVRSAIASNPSRCARALHEHGIRAKRHDRLP